MARIENSLMQITGSKFFFEEQPPDREHFVLFILIRKSRLTM